ncbi:hypothetical protein BpHYR1_016934 [Brachionus plicatilis]|uniref:Secreted protein n=1 Tax=Brachionus plicatilis TaxID=10195 RepID=A0A3M7SSI5_BRAPC|nr:hypothetical protein BpHYR1_016934 [Brachionus plicatilis]
MIVLVRWLVIFLSGLGCLPSSFGNKWISVQLIARLTAFIIKSFTTRQLIRTINWACHKAFCFFTNSLVNWGGLVLGLNTRRTAPAEFVLKPQSGPASPLQPPFGSAPFHRTSAPASMVQSPVALINLEAKLLVHTGQFDSHGFTGLERTGSVVGPAVVVATVGGVLIS